jgi:hypothetical protein
MNLHPRYRHYDTVACSGRKARGNLQSCVGYRMCCGTRGVVLSMSRVSSKLGMLAVCQTREEKRMELNAGRRDIYTWVYVI